MKIPKLLPPRPPKSKLRPSKIFLIFLITACVVVTVYTGYLLFTHQTNWVVWAIVLAADIGVLIWNISALRRWSVGAGTVISIFLVIAFLGATACAFSGVEPFATYKDLVSNKITTFISQDNITSEPTYPSNIKFRGTYRTLAPWLGIEQTLSFKGNTLITEDILTGTNVFEYSATMESETKGFIEFTNVASGETSIQLFTYNKEADCIILHTTTRDSGGLTYCR